MIHDLLYRLRALLRRDSAEADLDEELRFHLEHQQRKYRQAGLAPGEALRQARADFGGVSRVKEECRESWGIALIAGLLQDAGYALRMLRKSPGFTAAAVLSLALGIGANTAIFSLLYHILLRPLPVAEPGQLVELLQKYPGEPRRGGGWSFRSYEHLRGNNTVFHTLMGTGIDNAVRLQPEGLGMDIVVGEFVTGNYFSGLGLRPALGRLLLPGDDPVSAVLSWSYWDSRFHQDPGVLGKRITVQGKPAIIRGIAPKGFVGLRTEAQTSVWLPSDADDVFHLVGRLKPQATIAQAQAEMEVLYRFTIDEHAARSNDPQIRQLKVEVESAASGFAAVRDRVGSLLTALMAVVTLLLLLVCTNLAGLLAARGASREQEFGLRAGLGASRARLFRQILTESLLLALLGAAAGLVVTSFSTQALVRILASGRPLERLILDIRMDGTTIAFAAAVSVLTGVCFGLAPALHLLRGGRGSALRQGRNSAQTRSGRCAGNGLLAGQVVLSAVLVSLGGLFVTHLQNLQGADLGFQRDNILLVSVDTAGSGYSRERLAVAYQGVLDRVKAIPGVRSASLSAPTPLSGAGASGYGSVEGYREPAEQRRWISMSYVGPGYFETMGTPLLAGRAFTAQESAQVAILNQTLARQYFQGRDPIGKTITMDHITGLREPVTYEIVGVAGDANYYEIREPERRVLYVPAFRNGRVFADSVVIRTAGNPGGVAGAARLAVQQELPNARSIGTTTLAEQIDATIVPERLVAGLSGMFAAVGALLAGIGIYGLLAFTVARRTSEIGVRIALGAHPAHVVRAVVTETAGIVAAGLLASVPLSMAAQRLAMAVFPGLSAPPLTAAGLGAAAILAIAMFAAYVPVRCAVRVDPAESLRHD